MKAKDMDLRDGVLAKAIGHRLIHSLQGLRDIAADRRLPLPECGRH
jgi:hypothetical protein